MYTGGAPISGEVITFLRCVFGCSVSLKSNAIHKLLIHLFVCCRIFYVKKGESVLS